MINAPDNDNMNKPLYGRFSDEAAIFYGSLPALYHGRIKDSLPQLTSPMKERFANGLNTVLMFDLFFVLFSFVWFAIALLGRAANVNLGFDIWYSLWDPVIMPAIGILMAGALVSGLFSWVSQKFLREQ